MWASNFIRFAVVDKDFCLPFNSKVRLANEPPNLKILPRAKFLPNWTTAGSKGMAKIFK